MNKNTKDIIIYVDTKEFLRFCRNGDIYYKQFYNHNDKISINKIFYYQDKRKLNEHKSTK